MREELEERLRYLEEQKEDLKHLEQEMRSAAKEFEQSEYRSHMQYEEQLLYAEKMPFLREILTEQRELVLEADRNYRDMQEEMQYEFQKRKRSCEEEYAVCRRALERAEESDRDREE